MEDQYQGRQDNKNVRDIAKGILNGEIFTSRHVWIIAEGHEDTYMTLMKKVFEPESITKYLKTLQALLVSDLFNGTLFYGFTKNSKVPFDMNNVSDKHLPHFTDISFLFGPDLEELDKTLKETYKEAMN